MEFLCAPNEKALSLFFPCCPPDFAATGPHFILIFLPPFSCVVWLKLSHQRISYSKTCHLLLGLSATQKPQWFLCLVCWDKSSFGHPPDSSPKGGSREDKHLLDAVRFTQETVSDFFGWLFKVLAFPVIPLVVTGGFLPLNCLKTKIQMGSSYSRATGITFTLSSRAELDRKLLARRALIEHIDWAGDCTSSRDASGSCLLSRSCASNHRITRGWTPCLWGHHGFQGF